MPFAKHSCHRSIQFRPTLFVRPSRLAVVASAVSGAVWMFTVPAAVAQTQVGEPTNCTEAAVKYGVCTEVHKGTPTPRPGPQQPSIEDQRRSAELKRQRDVEWSSEEAADYAKRGDWNNAIRSFEEALDRDPDNEALARDLAQARAERTRVVNLAARPTPPIQPPTERVYKHSGNAFMAGTGWQAGYYSPIGASAAVKARAREMLRDQARLAGAEYDQQVNLDRYNFVIGVANKTTMWRDLATRVVFEQLLNGQLSAHPETQRLYNALRGRAFDELGCHSNGAMTCLAALMNRDIKATDVILYGPQITPESLLLWNRLLSEKRISSLRILIAENDPITPVSMLLSPLPLLSPYAAVLAAPVLFKVDNLATAIRAISPSAKVNTFACGSRPALACHNMALYTEQRPICSAAKGTRPWVPGTRIVGDRKSQPLREPPTPRC